MTDNGSKNTPSAASAAPGMVEKAQATKGIAQPSPKPAAKADPLFAASGSNRKRGVLLVSMGGPDSLSSVDDYLMNIFSDRELIALSPFPFLQNYLAKKIVKKRAPITRANYAEIGGSSPLLKNTKAQADALQDALNEHEITVYVGMRYFKPTISEALRTMRQDKIRELVVIPMYPQYSKATGGSIKQAFRDALSEVGFRPNYRFIDKFYDHPKYIEAVTDLISKTIDKFGVVTSSIGILFSAHGVPKKFIAEGDPYEKQVKESVRLLMRNFEKVPNFLAFQSRSGPVKWLEPDTAHAVKAIAAVDIDHLVVVPLSFVSDHIETLYELDIELKKIAGRAGIGYYERTPVVGTDKRFIQALREMSLTEFDKMRSI